MSDRIRALLVDDERLARAELRRLLAAFPQIAIAGEAANVAEGVRQSESLRPDVLFLDISMPDGTGFDLLGKLEEAPLVVFSTAYDEHAVRAFEVSALDYLLKPVEAGRLAAAVGKIEAQLARRSGKGALGAGGSDSAHDHPARAASIEPVRAGKPLERVFVREGDRCWLVTLDELPLISSEGNFARLHLADGEPLLARSLQHLEDRLDPAVWFRASRQQLINLGQIARMNVGLDGRLIVELKTGQTVELSRRQSQRFRERTGG